MDQNPYLGRTVGGNADQDAIRTMNDIIEQREMLEQYNKMNRQQRRAFMARVRKLKKQQAKK